MPKHIKTLDDLEQEFTNAKTKAVIIDFYATWCGPCKTISPKLELWEKNYPNIIVLKVDVDESEQIAEKYEISAMPTFLVFKEAKLVETIIGANVEKVESAFKKFSESEHDK